MTDKPQLLTDPQLECALDNLENRADGNLHATGNQLREHIAAKSARIDELEAQNERLRKVAEMGLRYLENAGDYPQANTIRAALEKIND